MDLYVKTKSEKFREKTRCALWARCFHSLAGAEKCCQGCKLALTKNISHAGERLLKAFSPHLSWSHYRTLMRVDTIEARDFYEREAVAGAWDKRTLERQIQSFLLRTNSQKPPSRENASRWAQTADSGCFSEFYWNWAMDLPS